MATLLELELNEITGQDKKCSTGGAHALSDWAVAAVGKGDGYVAHYGPHLCLCNFGNSGYQSVTTK